MPTRTTPGNERAPVPRGFWPIWSTVVIDLVGFGIVVPVLALYAKRYGASGLTVGLLFTVFSLAQFLCSPLLGRLSDRIGRRPVIVISLLGTAIGSLITGLAGSLWVLFVGRAVDGASGASLAVAQAAVTDLAPPAQRPRLVGLLGAAFGIGFVAGPAIGGLASLGGPRVPFFVAAGLALVNAIAAWRRVPETRTAHDAPVARAGTHRALTPVLSRLAVVGLVTTAAFSAFEATFALLTKARFGLGQSGVAWVFVGIGVVLAATQGGVYHRLVGRLGTGRIYLSGLAVLAAGLAVLAGATVWAALLVALALLTVGQGLASPSLIGLVGEHAPGPRRGQAMGFQQSAYAMGRIVGPPVGGWLFDHAGTWSPFAVAAGACALMLIPAAKMGGMDASVHDSGATAAVSQATSEASRGTSGEPGHPLR